MSSQLTKYFRVSFTNIFNICFSHSKQPAATSGQTRPLSSEQLPQPLGVKQSPRFSTSHLFSMQPSDWASQNLLLNGLAVFTSLIVVFNRKNWFLWEKHQSWDQGSPRQLRFHLIASMKTLFPGKVTFGGTCGEELFNVWILEGHNSTYSIAVPVSFVLLCFRAHRFHWNSFPICLILQGESWLIRAFYFFSFLFTIFLHFSSIITFLSMNDM